MHRTRSRVFLPGLLLSGLVGAFLLAGETMQFGQSTPPPTATISVEVKRVGIDVVVRDSSGKPVTGLTQSDFRITEDGRSQPIRTFDAYSADAGNMQAKAPISPPRLPPNTVSNFSAVTQTGPLTVVLYDLLNTPLNAQPFARAQLLEFLDKRPKTSPVAIFVLTDSIHLLQGFTDDDKALKLALTRQSNYKSTELLTASDAPTPSVSSLDSVVPSAQPPQSQAQTNTGRQNSSPGQQLAVDQVDSETEVDELLLHEDALQNSAFLDRRVEITTSALRQIALFLSSLPGRKNLIWLSGSFPAGVLPNSDPFAKQVGGAAQPNTLAVRQTASSDYEVVRNYSDLTRQATNALNESHTAVYPVDARGLQTSTANSAEVAPVLLQRQAANQVASLSQVRDSFAAFNKQGGEQTTMDSIATDTGGRAAYNTNGLAGAALSAVDDGSTYYTLTYQPTNTKTDGKLRNIKVECLKRGYTLAYRRNYFADSSKRSASQSAQSSTQSDAVDPMLVALRRGAPPAHSLFFEAHLQTLGEAVPATPQELQELSQFQPKDTSVKRPAVSAATKPVMMRHYAITYGLVAHQLDLSPGPDNQRHAKLEFAAMAYDRDGTLLKGVRTTIDDTITPARYERLQQNGYQTIQRIGIPVNAATLRIGVRDAGSRNLGSTEIHLPLATEAPAK